jgi:uncharacterized protein
MHMYQNRNKDLEVLALFMKGYSKQYYLREIAKLAKIPLKTTQNLVNLLTQNNILKSHVSGKNKYFGLNLDNVETKLCLLKAEAQRTISFMNKYSLFKTFLKEIKADELLIVFGSFARFNAHRDSDLDLLMITNVKLKLPLHLLPYKAHKIELSKKAFKESVKKNEPLIKEIEENHIILNNHSSYLNVMWDYYGKK